MDHHSMGHLLTHSLKVIHGLSSLSHHILIPTIWPKDFTCCMVRSHDTSLQRPWEEGTLTRFCWASHTCGFFHLLSLLADFEPVTTFTIQTHLELYLRPNMPDITLSFKRLGHDIYRTVHTSASKCKVVQQWGCLSRHNIIWCVGVRAASPYQNQQQTPKTPKKRCKTLLLSSV